MVHLDLRHKFPQTRGICIIYLLLETVYLALQVGGVVFWPATARQYAEQACDHYCAHKSVLERRQK